MNILRLTTAGPAATAIALFSMAGGVQAEDMSMSPQSYENELERCVVAVRPELNLNSSSLVRHLVSDIERRGPWYVFDIETTVKLDDGTVTVDSLESTCKANRWTEDTRLFVKNVEAPAPTRVASND